MLTLLRSITCSFIEYITPYSTQVGKCWYLRKYSYFEVAKYLLGFKKKNIINE